MRIKEQETRLTLQEHDDKVIVLGDGSILTLVFYICYFLFAFVGGSIEGYCSSLQVQGFYASRVVVLRERNPLVSQARSWSSFFYEESNVIHETHTCFRALLRLPSYPQNCVYLEVIVFETVMTLFVDLS